MERAGHLCAALVCVALVVSRAAPLYAVTITADTSVRYQTLRGWEASTGFGQWDYLPSVVETWRESLLDAGVAANINAFRVDIPSGIENDNDCWQEWVDGFLTTEQMKGCMENAVNDNADPNVADTAKFYWSYPDHLFDQFILPYRTQLAAEGEPLYLLLQFNDNSRSPLSPFEHSDTASEYAEWLLQVYNHLNVRYGFLPDEISIANEPNNRGGWTATEVGNAINAAGDRLVAAGYPTPLISAPDVENTATAISWYDIFSVMPGVSDYLSDIAYHRYAWSQQALLDIASRAATANRTTSMNEWIGATYEHLHDDLTFGQTGLWSQYTLGFPNPGDPSGAYFGINTGPQPPTVNMSSRTKVLYQYFKFIRRGAIRRGLPTVGAVKSTLWVNPDGAHVVVVNLTGVQGLTVAGLPAGTYGISYSTAFAHNQTHPDQIIAPGETIVTSIPNTGALTVYGRGRPVQPDPAHHLRMTDVP